VFIIHTSRRVPKMEPSTMPAMAPEDTHWHVGVEDWRFRRGRGFRVWRKGGAWEGG
jgi:hypothetical protein